MECWLWCFVCFSTPVDEWGTVLPSNIKHSRHCRRHFPVRTCLHGWGVYFWVEFLLVRREYCLYPCSCCCAPRLELVVLPCSYYILLLLLAVFQLSLWMWDTTQLHRKQLCLGHIVMTKSNVPVSPVRKNIYTCMFHKCGWTVNPELEQKTITTNHNAHFWPTEQKWATNHNQE